MKKIKGWQKYCLVALGIASALFSIKTGYGGFFDNLAILENENTIEVGEWATAISTPQQFFDFATKDDSVSTDVYYLANDINFSSFTTWTYDYAIRSIVFRGTLYGNGKTLSNLDIKINNNSSYYSYGGIFPIMEGGKIYDLKLSKVNIVLNSTALGGSYIRSGLIAGLVSSSTNIIKNITITNCGVRATNSAGSGGLVGSVTGSSTIVNISNVKATGLKVFNKAANTGGIVGGVNTSGAVVNITDIDTQGEVFSYESSSYTGGIVGNIIKDGRTTIERVVTQQSSKNTLETYYKYRDEYSKRYLGGIIGRSQSSSTNVIITDTFFTGELLTSAKNRRSNVGTLTGSYTNAPNKSRTYYAKVQFRSSNGSTTTSVSNPTGQMADLVDKDNLPDSTWWNDTFYPNLNSLWALDQITGRAYLVR